MHQEQRNRRGRHAGNTPVSYTHLDVYKRQVLDPVDPSQTASGLALDMDLNLLMGKAVHLDGYGPVSYTHLDVYKRQSQLSVEQQTLRLHPLVVDAFNGQVRAEGSMACLLYTSRCV